MLNKIGVESAYGFGDCLFNAPLLKAIKNLHNLPLIVAVQKQCEDAFYNLPWIDEIINISSLDEGISHFRSNGYQYTYQITQNILFLHYKQKDPTHSLIDTPSWFAHEKALSDFNPRPIFIPTSEEVNIANELLAGLDTPIIGIESVAKSGQSWIDQKAVDMILDAHINTHKILWFSNGQCPAHPRILNMSRFTRRQLIMMLRGCEKFYTTGSGFFCAALSLAKELQPKQVIALWIDEYYKYESRLCELQYHPNIRWAHNHVELSNNL